MVFKRFIAKEGEGYLITNNVQSPPTSTRCPSVDPSWSQQYLGINLLVAAAPAAIGAAAHIIAVSLALSVAVLVRAEFQALFRIPHIARLVASRPKIAWC